MFAYAEPLTSPDDFAGTTIRSPHSATTYAFFETLGATVDDLDGSEFELAVFNGELAGVDSSFIQTGFGGAGTAPAQLVATGNVTPYPNVNSLVINTEVFDGLSAEQQAILREAVALTRDAIVAGTVGTLADDATAAEEFCAFGGQIVLASDDDLAAFADAAQPVYDELNQDAATAALIERIGQLKAQTPAPPVVEACGAAAVPVTMPEGTDDPSALNGTYEFEWTEEELFNALPEEVPENVRRADAGRNAGVARLTFADGRFELHHGGEVCAGSYSITGERIVMVATTDPREYDCGSDSLGALWVDAVWDLTDGQLVLSDFVLTPEPGISWWNEIYLAKPMTRID